ncbi:hypothetical protein M5D96_006464, partial [Drosophila gunungcola]
PNRIFTVKTAVHVETLTRRASFVEIQTHGYADTKKTHRINEKDRIYIDKAIKRQRKSCNIFKGLIKLISIVIQKTKLQITKLSNKIKITIKVRYKFRSL